MKEQPDAQEESRDHIGRVVIDHRGHRRVVQPSVPVPGDDADEGESDRIRNERDDRDFPLVAPRFPFPERYIIPARGTNDYFRDPLPDAPAIGSPDYLRKFFPHSYEHAYRYLHPINLDALLSDAERREPGDGTGER